MTQRCVDCGAPADWAAVDDTGSLYGYVCVSCDYKRRRQRLGWRRRQGMRLRHFLHRF